MGTTPRAHPRFYWDTWILVFLAFVPLLLTKTGLLTDDTKIYLYLDPVKLVESAASLWSHDFGFGTVTHQNIGYLLPMGPYYVLAQWLHVPLWIAQRLWLGSLLLFAGLGARRCAEEFGLSRWAGWATALPYMLTPYILVNLDRTSAILMPWAGLGWMMVYTVRAARRNDWRHPALFALIVALVGGVNATSILMVAFAPLLYLLFAAGTREISWRRCGAVIARISVLSLVVSVWWVAGLWAEGKYGINILRFTESFSTVTFTSTSSEVFRGLGYWYFYGRDSLQPWTLTSLSYMTGKVVPTASFIVPAVGFVAALCIRWRYRLLCVAITFLGVVVAVGSYPLNAPTAFGSVFKYLALHTTAALALRSTNRVVPIVVLGLALLAGAGLQALHQRAPRPALIGGCCFVGIAMIAMLPLFEGKAISSNLTFPSTLPTYVTNAANELDTGSATSNVIGLPGEDFAYYRFGAANDSIWPGITDRPWISSQVQLEGEPASINLIRGLDSTLQNGIAVPSSIVPIARLFNASDILVQMNLQYERYASPTPWYLDNLLSPLPPGLTLVKAYGPRGNFQAVNGPYIDESLLGLPIGYKFPHQLEILKVSNPRPLVRTESADSPEIVAGDGEGLVTMAETGLLNNDRAIFFDGSESRPAVTSLAKRPGAWLVLTDSNQKRTDTFGTLSATEGYVETANEAPLVGNLSEQTLPTFPDPPLNSETVAYMMGLQAVGASAYGNIITNNPEDQAFKAVDGNINTAWTVSAFSAAIGQFFQMTALAPVTVTKIHLIQPQTHNQTRYITEVGIQVNGGTMYRRALSTLSTTPTGQTVTIPATTGSTIRLTILGDSDDDLDLTYQSAVGFATIGVTGFGPATRGLLLPTSLLSAVGPAAATDQLSIVTNRLRAATVPPRQDPELGLLRYVYLPYARAFTLSGLANLNPAASDDDIDTLLGRHATPGAGVSVASAEASSTLTGSLTYGPWSAFDANNATAWETRFKINSGQWVRAHLTGPVTVSHFSLTLINDGYHAIPKEITISNGTTSESVAIPITMAKRTNALNTEQTFSLTVPAITGSTFTFTFAKMRFTESTDRVTGGLNYPGLAVASIALPGVTPGVTPTAFSSGCQTGYLKIDGASVPVEVTGTSVDALDQNELSLSACGSATITLHKGMNVISSTDGYLNGVNINNVVLTSSAVTTAPVVAIANRPASWYGQTVVRSTVTSADAGRWLVLAQSFAGGWHASIDGHDLGAPTLVDGASMGWLLPSTITGTEPVAFVWEPQQDINIALLVSAIGLLVVLAMAIWDRPRRRRLATPDPAPDDDTPTWSGPTGAVTVSPPLLYAGAVLAGLAVSVYLIPVLVGLAWIWIRRRSLGAALAAAAALGIVVGAAITISATLGSFVRDISWPSHIHDANTAVWLGLALWVLAVVGTTQVSALRGVPVGPTPEDGVPRRRGLNVPATAPSVVPEATEIETIPHSGLSRSLFLLRAILKNRDNPVEWQSIVSEDSINQIVGKTPIFNRRVLDISDFSVGHAMVLVERGAHVTAMRREPPATKRALEDETLPPHVGAVLEFTPNHIPAPDHAFDLVFATNVLSSVENPGQLLAELVRVTRPGGTLYLQNVLWYSILGGRETSPWHLVSGRVAYRHYVKRHGREPVNRFGLNFFKLTPRALTKLIATHPELAVFIVGPRYLPMRWSWTVHVPLLRTLMIQDLVVVAERH